jgi:hypothetical protein
MVLMTRIRAVFAALCTATTVAAFACAPASAATLDTSCTSPSQLLSQPFASIGDSHWYTLAPGGDYDAAAGWQLSGGAALVTTTQQDGTTGGALDLPSKATAVSPVMCITSDYPTSRMWVRNIKGSEGVFFYVSYYVNGKWTNPKNTGQFHGDHSAWTLSNPMNVQPSSVSGWQPVRFTFIAGGSTSRFQVNDFWVDPRLRT